MKTVRISVSLDIGDVDVIRAVAIRRGQSDSAICREIIRDWVVRMGGSETNASPASGRDRAAKRGKEDA